MSDPAAVIKACLEAIWEGNSAALAGHPAYGPDLHATTIRTLHGAFADLKGTVDRQFVDGEWVSSWATLSGTLTGDLPYAKANGQWLEWKQASVAQIVDGKVVYYEGVSALAQILTRKNVSSPQ